MIPPALAKVGQLVLQRVLQQLEHDADDGAEPPVADDQRLQPPAEEVRRHEDVQFVLSV